MKQTYEIDDISRFLQDTIKVEAKTPLEAVKKAYPDYDVKRDYDNQDTGINMERLYFFHSSTDSFVDYLYQ